MKEKVSTYFYCSTSTNDCCRCYVFLLNIIKILMETITDHVVKGLWGILLFHFFDCNSRAHSWMQKYIKKKYYNYFYFTHFFRKSILLRSKTGGKTSIKKDSSKFSLFFIVTQYCDNKIIIYIMLPSIWM